MSPPLLTTTPPKGLSGKKINWRGISPSPGVICCHSRSVKDLLSHLHGLERRDIKLVFRTHELSADEATLLDCGVQPSRPHPHCPPKHLPSSSPPTAHSYQSIRRQDIHSLPAAAAASWRARRQPRSHSTVPARAVSSGRSR